jgi:flavorubredoxin
MEEPYRASEDVWVLPTNLEVPGVGALPINAFVLESSQPVLVDSGLAVDEGAFLEALRSVIDPAELLWIWLTHDDTDHSGNLSALMSLAPDARLATHAFGVLRMATVWPVPLDRVHALRPGDQIDAGDRILRSVRPPTFDNPMSLGLFDHSTSNLFSVDAFGAILPNATADIADVPEDALVEGMVTWATFDSPWTHITDRALFQDTLAEVRRLQPARILPSHLPPAVDRLDSFLEIAASVPDAAPFEPPDAETFAAIASQLGRDAG